MTPLLALLLIAVTYAAELVVRAYHVVPRRNGVIV